MSCYETIGADAPYMPQVKIPGMMFPSSIRDIIDRLKKEYPGIVIQGPYPSRPSYVPKGSSYWIYDYKKDTHNTDYLSPLTRSDFYTLQPKPEYRVTAKVYNDGSVQYVLRPDSDISSITSAVALAPYIKKKEKVLTKPPSSINLWIENEKRLMEQKRAEKPQPVENKSGIAPLLAAAAALFLITQG